jgi:hypothetical protein
MVDGNGKFCQPSLFPPFRFSMLLNSMSFKNPALVPVIVQMLISSNFWTKGSPSRTRPNAENNKGGDQTAKDAKGLPMGNVKLRHKGI